MRKHEIDLESTKDQEVSTTIVCVISGVGEKSLVVVVKPYYCDKSRIDHVAYVVQHNNDEPKRFTSFSLAVEEYNSIDV
jgi:hypothetical protein